MKGMMRFMRKYGMAVKTLLLLILTVFLLSVSVSANGEQDNEADLYDDTEFTHGENLIYNGDFEKKDSDGLPEGWHISQYRNEGGISEYAVVEDPEHGSVAEVWNMDVNDARLEQYVPVEPDTIYCLSGYIWAENVGGGHGANFSIDQVYSFSEEVFETYGEWQYVEYYGVTGPDQHQITVFARVGGYGGESTGKARFDGLSLREVYDEAEVVDLAYWYQDNELQQEDDSEPYEEEFSSYADNKPVPTGDGSNKYYTVYEYYADRKISNVSTSRAFLILAGTGWLAVFMFFAFFFRGGKRTQLIRTRGELWYFIPALLLAFAARIVISYHVEGYAVDVGCFDAWGRIMREQGAMRFYPYLKENGYFCDYPPLYVYILGLNSQIVSWTGADDAWRRVIFRLIPSICDVASCWLLYRYARRKTPEQIHRVCAVLILFALNPAAILNSAGWGQIDSVLCLMLLMVALCAVEGKWQAALPIYALSVLVKPQALILGILGLLYIILTWIRQKESRKPILYGVLFSVLSMAAVILPFGFYQPFGWLIERYRETLNSYQYASVNTANFYYLLGGNWDGIGNEANIAAPLILSLGCGIYGICWRASGRRKPYSWIESVLAMDFAFLFAVLAVMKASWGTVGTVAMVFSFIITFSFALRKKETRFLPFAGALLFLLLYVFGVKMHERYVFPAIFLLAAAWVVLRDRRILYLIGLFSLTLFINEGIILDNSIRIGPDFGHLLSDTKVIVRYGEDTTRYFLPHTVVFADILSFLNIGGVIYAIVIGYSMFSGERDGTDRFTAPIPFPDRIPRKRSPLDYHPDNSLHWNRIDSIILAAVIAVYSVITLTTLGSTKAPQNGWTSSGPDEEIIFDLGENNPNVNILYFGRISVSDPTDFTFSQSNDMKKWSQEVSAKMDYGEYWKWQYAVSSYSTEDGGRSYSQSLSGILRFQCRYIKLRAGRTGLRLNEIIFVNENGEPVEAKIAARTGGNPESVYYSDPDNLLDEQDTMESLPGVAGEKNGNNRSLLPSWWNSTYFDEIYHARTAYEFLHPEEIRHSYYSQPEPYESTHPPLGKLLMSASIAVFGMTPFGWRFAGALAGILMLPGIYLLAKQLTKKTSAAALAVILMALDCMHLTQTQIATIDSFPVLFIMFAYFFMLRYIQTDVARQPLRRTLIPLGLSGLFMGLAIASKWIGIYAGAGLALLFAWHGLRTIRISREAKRMAESGSVSPAEREQLLPYLPSAEPVSMPAFRKLYYICHWCVLFFVFIPAGIYLLSYIPYLAPRDNIHSVTDYLKAVWDCQLGMFSYHSEPMRGMDHPFYSPWYEWPVILKPMYYAARQYLNSRTKVSYSIYCIGNPIVWWSAIPALAYCVLRWMKAHCYQVSLGYNLPASRKKLFRPDIMNPVHLTARTYENRISFVLIGFLTAYLPWVLVPRGTYIYHYFASVPFMILFVCLFIHEFSQNDKGKYWFLWISLAVLSLTAFLVFFPYASGIAVSTSWLDMGAKVLRIGH